MDKLIIAIVSLIAIAGHVWLYRWVKFKIDEGAILNFLEQGTAHSCADIATAASLKEERVRKICNRSLQLCENNKLPDHWHRIAP